MIDVFELAGDDRPELSVLSDEFLDKVTKGLAGQPLLGVELLKRILIDEIRVREHANRMQARLFSDKLADALARYEATLSPAARTTGSPIRSSQRSPARSSARSRVT